MRYKGYSGAYEKLKELTRGKELDREGLDEFIEQLDVSREDKE